MNRERKTVAIVGGGIIGLSIAWRAAQRGCSATLFDKGTLGAEASWAGAGMLAPGGEVETGTAFARQLIDARAQYPAFIAELQSESGHTIEFQTNGALDLAYSEAERDELAARAQLQTALGVASKPVSAQDVHTFWPRIRTEGLVSARFVPGDAVVDPRQVVAALRAACERRRVLIHEDTPVTEVNLDKADFTIIAAGAWSSSINVESVPPLPTARPVRGHIVGYRQPLDTLATIVRRANRYFLQRNNGLLIAGASMERAGFDRSVDGVIVGRLHTDASFVLPHLGETTPTEVWNGLRPGADELQVGPWHSPRLLLAYGHCRNGILLAPWTADKIANLL